MHFSSENTLQAGGRGDSLQFFFPFFPFRSKNNLATHLVKKEKANVGELRARQGERRLPAAHDFELRLLFFCLRTNKTALSKKIKIKDKYAFIHI